MSRWFPVRACLLASVVLSVACSSTPPPSIDGGTNTCSGTTPRPFDELYDEYFAVGKPTGCSASGCHGTGAGGLTFTDAHSMWVATVGRMATSAPTEELIKVSDPTHSFLLQKLQPNAAGRMPPSGPYLSAEAIAAINDWICAGAPAPSASTDGGTPDSGTPDGGPPDAGMSPLSIATFSPTSGVVGTSVVIEGVGFTSPVDALHVTFGGVIATTSNVSDTSITALVPDGATSGPITVSLGDVSVTSTDSFQVIEPNPVPTLTSISPTSVQAGGSDLTLTAKGSGFVSVSVIELDGDALTTHFTDASTLEATISAAKLSLAGAHTITVTSPGPGGGTSSGVSFTVTNPAPSLASLSPTSAIVGSGDLLVTLNGQDFVAGSRVIINGAETAATYIDQTMLSVTLPASMLATTGSIALAVLNPGPGGGTTSSQSFQVENPLPVTSGLSFTGLMQGSGPITLTLTGSGFVSDSVVLIDGISAPTTFVNPLELQFTVSTGVTAQAGVYSVTVTNPKPGGGTSSALQLTVTNPPPSVSFLSPANVPLGTNGASLTISGDRFVSNSSVSINGTPVPATFVNSTTLTAQAPAAVFAVAGNFPLTVTNPTPGGGTSDPLTLAVTNPSPALNSLSPESVVAGVGATTLTVLGSGFVAGSKVQLSGTNVPTTFVSTGELSAAINATTTAVAGTNAITVVTPGPGGGTSAPLSFTVQHPVPGVDSASPTTLVIGSSASLVTLIGRGFDGATQATANGIPLAVGIPNAGGTQVTVELPAGLLAFTGPISIVVTNPAPGGGSAAPVTVTVVNPVPAIVQLSPAQVTAGTFTFNLNLSVSGLVNGTQVQFDGANLPSAAMTAVDMIATIDASQMAVGGVHAITLVNPVPGGGTSAAATFTVNNPAPTLSSISTTATAVSGAPFTLTVNGSGYNAASVVSFNGSAVPTTLKSSTQLTAVIPTIATAGSYPISVSTPAPGGGTSTSATLQAVVVNTPTITSIAPELVQSQLPFELTVRGSGYGCSTFLSIVHFDSTPLTPTSCSATELVVSVPAQPAGHYSVQVETNSQLSNAVDAAVADPNPVPTISLLSPNTAVEGDAAFTLTVIGNGFVAGSTVLFNGIARTTAYVSSEQLTAAIPALAVAAPGSFTVSVTSPAPGGGTSNQLGFTVQAKNPVPTVSSLSPSTLLTTAGATTITVTGSNFVNGAIATFKALPRTTHFVSATQVTVDLTAADLSTAGSFPIAVYNQAPGGGPSGNVMLTVIAPNPVPAPSTLSPSSAIAGGSTFTLTVNGASFVSGAVVSLNGVAKTTTFVSTSQLTASITAADIATAGNATVAVTNPTPGGGTSDSLGFTIIAPNPVPTLSSVSPSSVFAASGVTTLTLTGNNFIASSFASINGNIRTAHFVSATQLTMDLLASDTQTPGTVSIVVSNPTPGGGTSSSAAFNVVNPAPSVTSLSPASAVQGTTGFTLTVNGSGFVSSSSVLFNGSARTTTFVSSTQLTAVIPASDLTSAGIPTATVSTPTPGGGQATGVAFTVIAPNPAPSISSLSPTSAISGTSSLTVTLTGTGFIAASSVAFNGTARTTQFTSSTQLTVDLTSADLLTAGTFPITVTNPAPGGGTSSGFTFTLIAPNPVPTVSTPSPASIRVGSAAQTLTVNGTGFVSSSTIAFNGVTKSTTFVSATQLTATLSTADLSVAGTFPVTATSPTPGGGTSGSVSFSVTNPTPVISTLSPTSITAGASAQTLTVNGTDFVSGSVVSIDGSARTTTFINSTQLTAGLLASDLSTAGSRSITVTSPTPGGGTSSGATLTIAPQPNPVPSLSTLSPCGTVAGTGTFTLTLNGSNFVSTSTATFNGSVVTVTYVNATKLTATIPASLIASAPAGNVVNVLVSNPSPGGGSSSAVAFGVASATSTLSGNVQPLFNSRCIACHNASLASNGLDLSAGNAYGNLVGGASLACSGGRAQVVACAPQTSKSHLIAKITGSGMCSGGQMPSGSPLTAIEQQTIINWVAQGAPQ